MKKFLSYAAMAVVLLLAIDIVSGYFLFYYTTYVNANIQTKKTPLVTVVAKLHRMILTYDQKFSRLKSAPSPFYVPDDIQGYRTNPGEYAITMSHPLKTLEHVWTVRILSDGFRATSFKQTHYDRTIYVLGDSYVFGWGLSDQQTFCWNLQSFAGDYQWNVKNVSAGGYATTNMWLWLRDNARRITADDIVILSYADYYVPRNVADPGRIKEISSAMDHDWTDRDKRQVLKHSRGNIVSGKIEVDYVNLSCADNDGYCNSAPRPREYAEEVTRLMYQEILHQIKAKVFILFMSGQDQDNVMRLFKESGIPIIDIRPETYPYFVRDNIYDYDSHPGPLYHQNIFNRIKDSIAPLLDATRQ